MIPGKTLGKEGGPSRRAGEDEWKETETKGGWVSEGTGGSERDHAGVRTSFSKPQHANGGS